MTALWVLLGAAFCVGAGVIALAVCRISGAHSRREEAEEVERLIQEGRG